MGWMGGSRNGINGEWRTVSSVPYLNVRTSRVSEMANPVNGGWIRES